MVQNTLNQQTSPYLLQHADNPVHWFPWGDDAFKTAQKQDKPILLSIGYAACHWCHVMAHESFEDQKTADVMNDLFINIKVDREEHPDIDHIFQKALSLMGQHGGWPLTMFLTPNGQPFWGGTYFPNRAMYGRPSFIDVLDTISKVYHNDKDNVSHNVGAIEEALIEQTKPKGNGDLNSHHISAALNYAPQLLDPVYGGTNGAPKFPQPILFEFLWRANWVNNSERMNELIHLYLEKICNGGIYDHIGGGFSRYSTDEKWLVPHFEKMLYDNALMISLLTMIWRKFPNPIFKRSVLETIQWIFNEMKIDTDKGYAFAAALDADSEGVEGKYYVWDEDEIDELLRKDADFFKEIFDVTSSGNWEGKNILNRVVPQKDADEEKEIIRLKHHLYKERLKRIPPQRDTKILCDWNAMFIKSLAEAACVFQMPEWLAEAETLFTSLQSILIKDNQLHHSYCDGQWGSKAYLEDYANLCQAALSLFEATGKKVYFKKAIEWTNYLEDKFLDQETGGFRFNEDKPIDGLNVIPMPIQDNATPSGNGIMAHVYCDLYHLSAQDTYKEKFLNLIHCFGTSNPNEIFSTPNLASALIKFDQIKIIAITGIDPKKTDNALINKSFLYPSPNRKILLVDIYDPENQLEFLRDKVKVDNKETVYICQFGRCSLPITDIDDLESALSS